MQIHGLNKTTLLDYPGHVAATIFTGGCNFRCPFCHNGDLVLRPETMPTYTEEEIFSFLKKRKPVLSGVCITGGEPTLQKDLPDFISQIKDMGYLVKLDTNGSNPQMLSLLLNNSLLDYVAMDIKSGKSDYAHVAGCNPALLSNIEASVEILNTCHIPHEFRTTVVKGLHTTDTFHEIGNWLPSDSLYFLQSYKESAQVIDKSFSSFSEEEMKKFLEITQKYIPQTALRGI